MTRANATKKKVSPEPQRPTLDEEGYFCLKGQDLWRWRALEAELRAATVELEGTKKAVQEEIAKNPILRDLLSKQTELAGAISQAKTELLKVQGEIESAFGVSLADCAFDDRTGRLYHLTEEGQREGVRPSRRRRSKKEKEHGAA